MYGLNAYRNPAVMNELLSDLWIEQNVPGGLNSPLGQALDNMMGGNPNPTFGQRYNNMTGYGYNTYYRPAYGYQYLR
ncbi:unnamed protein product [Adineta ricciae]|uniref:Uncharacterized protein n=1 Tax=Adineta ricciae TaxID=249248 RepID=A0A816C2H7_ADIRI|nr:unnamed protein product [Adineta ricciae]CAF1618413.1 unnamed protein product [Adineta ricciae]